jgi:hypothetical protein
MLSCYDWHHVLTHVSAPVGREERFVARWRGERHVEQMITTTSIDIIPAKLSYDWYTSNSKDTLQFLWLFLSLKSSMLLTPSWNSLLTLVQWHILFMVFKNQFFVVIFFFETGSHYVGLVLNLDPSALSFWVLGYRDVQPCVLFFFILNSRFFISHPLFFFVLYRLSSLVYFFSPSRAYYAGLS